MPDHDLIETVDAGPLLALDRPLADACERQQRATDHRGQPAPAQSTATGKCCV
jgi:hypothetical protein